MKSINGFSNRYTCAVLFLLIVADNLRAVACEACKKQQPEFLQGITHGAGPDGYVDYLIALLMVLITLYVLVASVKCLIRPAEKDQQHIKRLILNN